MLMKTYVINLEKSKDRKCYMSQQLETLPFLDVEFVSAIDGRLMSVEEQNVRFDFSAFQKRYLKKVRPGEIGCTLSHQKCYKRLLESNENYALILEDDISVNGDIREIIEKLSVLLESEQPQIVLLSGWYWFFRSRPFYKQFRLANVYDGFLTHSYVINKSAARLLIESKPGITADDWKYIRRKGVTLKALLPHLIDQNQINGGQSLIQSGENKMMKGVCLRKIRIYWNVIILKGMKLLGYFEKA